MIYVDDMESDYGRMKLSHMFSDVGLDELHAMADAIGLPRRWFQDKRSLPHYDVCLSKRAAAVARGAVLLRYGGPEWRAAYQRAKLAMLHPADAAEMQKFQEYMRDRKLLRDAKAAGQPCPLTPERKAEMRAYIEGKDDGK